jgi:hypothetical protein
MCESEFVQSIAHLKSMSYKTCSNRGENCPRAGEHRIKPRNFTETLLEEVDDEEGENGKEDYIK